MTTSRSASSFFLCTPFPRKRESNLTWLLSSALEPKLPLSYGQRVTFFAGTKKVTKEMPFQSEPPLRSCSARFLWRAAFQTEAITRKQARSSSNPAQEQSTIRTYDSLSLQACTLPRRLRHGTLRSIAESESSSSMTAQILRGISLVTFFVPAKKVTRWSAGTAEALALKSPRAAPSLSAKTIQWPKDSGRTGSQEPKRNANLTDNCLVAHSEKKNPAERPCE